MTVALSLLAVAAVVAGRLHVLLQILQQEHYENARLYRWVRRDLRRLAPLVAAAVLAGGVLADWLGVIAAAAALAAAVAYAVLTWRRDQVKPLVFTGRAKRLFAVGLVIAVVPSVVAGAARRPARGRHRRRADRARRCRGCSASRTSPCGPTSSSRTAATCGRPSASCARSGRW